MTDAITESQTADQAKFSEKRFEDLLDKSGVTKEVFNALGQEVKPLVYQGVEKVWGIDSRGKEIVEEDKKLKLVPEMVPVVTNQEGVVNRYSGNWQIIAIKGLIDMASTDDATKKRIAGSLVVDASRGYVVMFSLGQGEFMDRLIIIENPDQRSTTKTYLAGREAKIDTMKGSASELEEIATTLRDKS